MKIYDIVIVGGGPAGLTAAVYGRRAGKSVLVLERNSFGGQITWSPKVENFPSIVSVSGLELGDKLLDQALEQGAEVELENVTGITLEGELKKLGTESGSEFYGKTVVIATGAKPRMMGLPEEESYIGNGVYFCAVCDGAFFTGRPVAVYGGGNSALQDALLLAETSSKVYLIHRRDSFRGEARLVEALEAKGNVEFVLNASVKALKGDNGLDTVILNANGEEKALEVAALFVAIGHEPDNSAFADFIELDKGGYAASAEDCLTKTNGVFVAGDCRRKKVKQLTTAVADGAVAGLAAAELC